MRVFTAPMRTGLLAGLVLLATLLAAGEALAHASLIRSVPADGSLVAEAPSAFALTFSEPASPNALKLVRPDGTTVALDAFVLRDATVDIAAPPGLGEGSYVLSWRVVSEDGHPVGGSDLFSVGAPSAVASAASATPVAWPVRGAIWFGRLVLYAGLFLGVGGVFFLSVAGSRSRPVRRFATGWIAAGLVAAPLSVGLQGLDALGLPLGDFSRAIVWEAGFATSLGTLAGLAMAALLVAPAALATRGAVARILSLSGLALVGLALASSGHAGAAPPQWLTRPAVFLHGVGIAFWVGALFPLAVALASPGAEASRSLRRFSRLAPGFVLVLIVSGGVLALVQVGSIAALWETAYGWVLLAKLALLAPLFALAAFNRFWLTRPAGEGDAAALARLRRSILAEIVLVALVLAVAGLWRFTPPPRVLAEAAAAPAWMHVHSGNAMADLEITPGRVGVARASIVLMNGEMAPLDAQEVTLVLSNPDAGIEPIRRRAEKPGDGIWRVDDLTLPVAGKWQARIDILVSDFELVKLENTIQIRR